MEKRGDTMKLVLLLGASGSGKTTYIENEIIKNQPLTEKTLQKVIVSHTDDFSLLLFGKYNVDKRCKGCDTLSMAIIDDLINDLKYFIDNNTAKMIVMDGDRINNNKMYEFLLQYKNITEIIYIDTGLDVIYERLKDCNKTFVKTTMTKTLNSINKYKMSGFKITHIQNKPAGAWF
jgi:predicted kinase